MTDELTRRVMKRIGKVGEGGRLFLKQVSYNSFLQAQK